jgi:hypothetical protein
MVEEDSCAVSNLRRASHALAPASPSHSHPSGADSYTHRGQASLGRDLVVGYSSLSLLVLLLLLRSCCHALTDLPLLCVCFLRSDRPHPAIVSGATDSEFSGEQIVACVLLAVYS